MFRTGNDSSKRLRALVLCAIMGIALLFAAPARVLARDYSIDKVEIDAIVEADGTLRVTEDRTFDFDGSFSGVYWDIPSGNTDGSDLGLTIESAGIVEAGSFHEFEQSFSGADRTVQIYPDSNGSTPIMRAKLYCRQENATATYRINYTISEGVKAYADVGVLYWKFVSDGWDKESNDVTCIVHLPVPSDEEVKPKDNVWMWAHGPLNGHIEADGDDIVITVPQVGTEEFAEARITFPTEWLSGKEPLSQDVFDEIVREEDGWRAQAEAKRNIARIANALGIGIPGVGVIAALVMSVFTRIKYKQTHTPQFQEDYFRDVPTDDHPAVLGTLWRGGEPDADDFVASLMQLTDKGIVGLDSITVVRKGLLGRTKETKDYRLNAAAELEKGVADKIDRATLNFLFQKIAPKTDNYSVNADGTVSFVMSDMQEVAKEHPESYDSAKRSWESSVKAVCDQRNFFEEDSGFSSGPLMGVGVVELVGGVIMGVISGVILENPFGIVAGVVLSMAGMGATIYAAHFDDLSSEAVEIRAKLKALRRWLKDFTRLGEAVPQDVVLWNRLLVMAVVLDVAKEVIDQLEKSFPEILRSEGLTSTYMWHTAYIGDRTPFDSVRSSYVSAAHVSSAELSSDSSSSGGGGGFSGGGGGGFGGGGGGGAF